MIDSGNLKILFCPNLGFYPFPSHFNPRRTAMTRPDPRPRPSEGLGDAGRHGWGSGDTRVRAVLRTAVPEHGTVNSPSPITITNRLSVRSESVNGYVLNYLLANDNK
jgi:hypothetical protein